MNLPNQIKKYSCSDMFLGDVIRIIREQLINTKRSINYDDLIVLLDPNCDLKSLKSLGFKVKKINFDDTLYDEQGMYKFFKFSKLIKGSRFIFIVQLSSQEELDFLKVSNSDAIVEIIKGHKFFFLYEYYDRKY